MKKSKVFNELDTLCKDEIILMDGPMGTMVQKYKLVEEDYRGDLLKNHSLDLKGNNEVLNITRPDIIKEIHKSYIKSGSKIIETNTFGATSIAQSDYKLEHLVEKMNIESVKAVKQAINESNSDIDKSKIFIAGAMGPTNRTASISPDVEDPGKRNVTFDELVNKVKSPKGTTEAGLNSLIVDNFDNIIFNAIRQATNRSIEISTELKNE